MTRRRLALPLLATLAAGVAAPAAAEVVARAGAAEVTGDELRTYLDSLAPAERAALAKDPTLLAQVARAYLARQAVLREAQARKWDARPEVKAQLDRVRDETLEALYVQAISQPPEGYPSAAEVQAAYDANRKAFDVPRQWRLAQIFVAAPKGAAAEEEKARRRVEEIKRLLAVKGADFAAVAMAHTDEKEAVARGGEIGWLAEAQLVPGLRPVVSALAKGAIAEPVQLDDGWHVVRVLETKEPSTRPLPEVREALVARLRADRAQANRQAYLARLLEQAPPAINELALGKLVQAGK
jgi:peptidylprolyl isomerase